LLAVLYAALSGTAVIALVEVPDRPMTWAQIGLFYLLSYLPGLGLAMLSDPEPDRVRKEYLKVDFYAPKAGAGGDQSAARSPGPKSGAAGSREGGTV